MGGGGQFKEGKPQGLHILFQLLQPLPVRGNIHLVSRHQHGPGGQLGGVLGKLGVDGLEILHRVPALTAGHIHHMDEQPAPVNVPQEVVAQPRSVGGPLNDAGDIRQHEGGPLLQSHHPQIGGQSGKMVVGDLGLGPCHHRKEGGLPHIGEPHQPHIGQQLQLQGHIPLLPRQPRLGKVGHLPGGGGEVLVAPAPLAPPAEDKAVLPRHVADDLPGGGVPDHGAPRDPDGQVLPVLAGAAPALAGHPVGGHILPFIAKIHQCGHMPVHLQNDVAPLAPVTPVGAAGGHILLPVEGHGPAAACSRPHGDPGLVNKSAGHSGTSFLWRI